MHKKLQLILPAIIILLGSVYFLTKPSTDSAQTPSQQNEQSGDRPNNQQDTAKATDKRYIRIAAMGDMLPHDTINLRAKTSGGYDYLPMFSEVSSELEGADAVFCNQESPSAGENFGISGYPTFNAPTKFSADLSKYGCNLINLANNHIADKGQAGIDATLSTWDKLNTLAVSGANSSVAQQNQISYFDIAGKKFAFIAFTDSSNNTQISDFSINMFSESLATSLATEASANADYVIASTHWGVEDSPSTSASQQSWAQLLADGGVDLIIGTGPHVLQPVEKINDTVVLYSLGNFLSTQLTVEQLVGGIAFIDIPLGEGDPVISFLPTYMSYTWTADEASREDLLARDNLKLYPLDKAQQVIKESLFNTTSNEQLNRVTSLLNSGGVTVEILKSN